MLRNDVVEAVRNGLFSVFPVTHVDEGIEILTGIPAGELNTTGNYPPDTINGLAVARLGEMTEKLKKFSESSNDDEE
jgi:hypothetical protein